jgi:predicted metal-dependent hydrolase
MEDAKETKSQGESSACDCGECSQEIEKVLRRMEERDEANARIVSQMYAKIEQLTDFVMKEQSTLRNQIAKLSTAQTSNPVQSSTTQSSGNLTATYFLDIETKLSRIEGRIVKLASSNPIENSTANSTIKKTKTKIKVTPEHRNLQRPT